MALRQRWRDPSCRERSGIRVGQDRFCFVVGKGVFKPRFEGVLRRRICSGMDADALFPQSQVALKVLALVGQHPAAAVHVES